MNTRLSIIIPFYNEETTLVSILKKIINVKELNNSDVQFILVNDGSTDKSKEAFFKSDFFGDERFLFIDSENNKGKGAAIRAAIGKCDGTYTIIQDADLEYDPSDIVKLLNTAEKDDLSVLYGSRNLNNSNKRGGFSFYWGGRLLTTITNILYGTKLTDEATCYKLFKTDLLKSLPLACNKFEFCPEVTALIAKRKYEIKELPITYLPRDKKHGKKINWRDGVAAIWELFKHKVSPERDCLIFGLISSFIFGVYLSTWSGIFMGYEKETADAALALLEGRYEVKRAGIGAAIMYLPFAIFVKSASLEQAHRFLTLVPIFYSALIGGILYLISVSFKINRTKAIVWSIIISLGSLTWPYSKIGMEYQASLLITLIFYLLTLWKNKKISLWYTGIALAYLTITKSYGAIMVIPVLAYVILNGSKINKKIFSKEVMMILFSLSTAIAYTLIANFLKYNYAAGAYYPAKEFQIWSWWEGFYGVFFSFGRSIFIYSPLLILVLFYWPNFYREQKDSSVYILGSFVILLLITAPFSYWTDETLGVRKLLPIIPLLHFPLLYLNFTGALRKIIVTFIIFIAIYTQLINSFYSYGQQLSITRPANLDYFSSLRYNPFVSHIYLNNYFFTSFIKQKITGQTQNFVYLEKSWMRCCTLPKAENEVLININRDISQIIIPSTYIIKIENQKKHIVTAIIVFLITTTTIPLTSYILKESKYKKTLV